MSAKSRDFSKNDSLANHWKPFVNHFGRNWAQALFGQPSHTNTGWIFLTAPVLPRMPTGDPRQFYTGNTYRVSHCAANIRSQMITACRTALERPPLTRRTGAANGCPTCVTLLVSGADTIETRQYRGQHRYPKAWLSPRCRSRQDIGVASTPA